MSANLEAKKTAVEEIKNLITSSKSIVLLDYRGITVSQDTALRKNLRTNNVVYKVIKNTLFKKACEQLGLKTIAYRNIPTKAGYRNTELPDSLYKKKRASINKETITARLGLHELIRANFTVSLPFLLAGNKSCVYKDVLLHKAEQFESLNTQGKKVFFPFFLSEGHN